MKTKKQNLRKKNLKKLSKKDGNYKTKFSREKKNRSELLLGLIFL
jgi:hypothetical protein